jgi:citrate synthase
MKQMDVTRNGSSADAELHVGESVLHMPIEEGTEGERAMDVSALLKNAGVTTLDYGYANTASTHSAITFLDGDNGILRYRGYPSSSWPSRPASSRLRTC